MLKQRIYSNLIGGEFLFTPEEIKIIDLCDEFKDIRYINNDGSIQIDVFNLYKDDAAEDYLVVEEGITIFKDNLQGCLDYIHKWI